MTAKVTPRLLSREDAAAYLGAGLTYFDDEIRPSLTVLRHGRKVVFDREELDRWVERQKAGVSSGEPSRTERKPRTSASRTRGIDTSAPRVKAILRELQERPRESMPRLYPVDGGRSTTAKG
jgi:hypothetical protein